MKVTSALLRRKRACQEQIDEFVELFPKGVEITEALCVQHAQVFNWDWAAENLLHNAALAEYERVTAPALAEYDRVRATALAEYDRVRATAWVEYNRVRAATFGRLAETK